jgi:hypothetical protein
VPVFPRKTKKCESPQVFLRTFALRKEERKNEKDEQQLITYIINNNYE